MNLILALLLNATAILITDYFVAGIYIQDFRTAVLGALVMGVINTAIKPFLSMLTAPTNFITLTLFTFIVNALLLYLASMIVSGFIVDSPFSAIFGAIVLSVVASVFSMLIKSAKKTSVKPSKKKKRSR